MLLLTRSQWYHSALIARRLPPSATPLRFIAAMSPKLKRKAAEGSPPSKKRVKKTDTMDSQVSVASMSGSKINPPGQPTNTQLPDKISFPERIPGTRRISAWNICSWASSNKKVWSTTTRYTRAGLNKRRQIQGFGRYVEAEDADILVLTETKVCMLSLSAIVFTHPFPRSTSNQWIQQLRSGIRFGIGRLQRKKDTVRSPFFSSRLNSYRTQPARQYFLNINP